MNIINKMSALSPELMYFASRMSGFSTNIFKLETNNSTQASANSIISVDLPSNSIINLRSFAMFCSASANEVASQGGRLPPLKDLIERVEVTMGGVVLSQGTNFTNVLCEAKKAVSRDYTDACVGHAEYVRAKSYIDNATLTGTANENVTSLLCCNEWEGFLGTADPMLFDTALVPPIRVRLYCATDAVLSSVTSSDLGIIAGKFADTAGADATSGPPKASTTPAGGAKYKLSDLQFQIECINLADATYENMLAGQMQSNGDLEVPYKAYYTFVDTHTGSSKFSVASSSMDRIWLAWRGSDFNTQSTPVTIGGYKIGGGFTSDTSGGAVAIELGKPQYDLGGVLGTNEEKYKGRYFNFSQPVGTWGSVNNNWKVQAQLNGAYFPQYSANVSQLYQITKNSLEGRSAKKDLTLDQYRKNYCVQCLRLNMPNSEYSRSLSGVDSRATNLAGVIRSDNTELNPNLTIFVECTEILNISAGRSISVVV